MANPNVQDLQKATVTVVYNGRVETVAYEPHQAAQALIVHVFDAFGVATGREELGLFTSAGVEVTPGASVAERGVHPGEQLLLRQRVVRGG